MTGRQLALTSLLLTALASSTAHAQAPDRAREALELGYQADNLFAKGRWEQAYERFAEAESRAHSPVFVLYMARCRRNAGRLIESRVLYERVANERLGPEAPQAFVSATEDAKNELGEARAKIPSLVVHVTGSKATLASVFIDGKRVSAETPTEIDPGEHAVEAKSGSVTSKKRVSLAPRSGSVAVEIALGAESIPSKPATHGSSVPAWIALSAGVVGLGVGAVTGSMATSKANDVKSRCDGAHCLRSDAEELDQARTLATVSTIAFAVGGVGVGTAVVLFVVGRDEGAPDHPSAVWTGINGRF